MTHSQSTLHKPDAQFLAQANTIHEQCHQHEPDWQIDPPRLMTYDMFLSNANTAYAANNDEAKKWSQYNQIV